MSAQVFCPFSKIELFPPYYWAMRGLYSWSLFTQLMTGKDSVIRYVFGQCVLSNTCLFTSIKMSFEEQRSFILIKSNFFLIILLWIMLFVTYLSSPCLTQAHTDFSAMFSSRCFIILNLRLRSKFLFRTLSVTQGSYNCIRYPTVPHRLLKGYLCSIELTSHLCWILSIIYM